MTILLAAMLASAQPLPFINRTEIDAMAQIESLQAQAQRRVPQGAAKLQLASNMRVIATVCGAASCMADPAAFLSELGSAYAMSKTEVAVLRETCAVYLTGWLDARRAALAIR